MKMILAKLVFLTRSDNRHLLCFLNQILLHNWTNLTNFFSLWVYDFGKELILHKGTFIKYVRSNKPNNWPPPLVWILTKG